MKTIKSINIKISRDNPKDMAACIKNHSDMNIITININDTTINITIPTI